MHVIAPTHLTKSHDDTHAQNYPDAHTTCMHALHAGLPPCAFAAAVPNNWTRQLGELADAVWRDQAAMVCHELT
jgi:hypothetical protein